mmetsp:Transcript_262/g.355  ORF Transcript_262/g.355 Transcript_262/m.355 type:complete len:334 (-) Transcript_262:401-1402(-)
MTTKTIVEDENYPEQAQNRNNTLLLLFKSCSFNSLKNKPSEEIFDSSSEEEYGDEDTVLSFITSRRSILESQRIICVPLLPTDPPPLGEQYWCEPDASTFRVRGDEYVQNKKKVPSGQSLFRLFAVDLVKVKQPIMTGMCNHPNERIQKCIQAKKEGKPGTDMPPFIFVVNITIPGKPAFHVVMYYAVDDISLITPPSECDDESPNPAFTKLAYKFFFGSSDTFRDKTFKLIPRIVKGNFIVKKAVGSKPTLLGTKVKQRYIRGDNFFELIVDVGSDKIANKVVGLSRGYAENLVVDLGFVLEGKSKSTLPEQVMGTVRLTNVDFKAQTRLVS